MAIIKCKMCGGDLNIQEGVGVAQCEYCGTQQTVPSDTDAKKLTLFARANRLRAACEFDKAASVYESIVADFPQEAEAYWGLVLCRYGIEYVDDPRTGKKIPTCHRSSFDSVLDDGDFEQALENADVVARRIYREEAKLIETLRRGIVEVSGKEEPYDIFICYKETDENGNRTVDSLMAQDVYDELTKKGYRVFFSRVTLEQKLGIEYEPYIFAALNSAKLMLVIGTDYEYFNAVWVKNEWNRFLMLMEAGSGKTLIPCYKGIDAYDMPREFAKLQAQDMGKVGAMQDLLRGVDKIMGQNAEEGKRESASAPADTAGPTVQSLTERAHIFLEDGDFGNAGRYFDRVLDIEPKNAEAYFGKFVAQCRVRDEQELVAKATQFEIKPQTERREVCPEDTQRIEALVEKYKVPGYLSVWDIRHLLKDYNRAYDAAMPYLEGLVQRQKALLDGSREFVRAEQYAQGDFAAHLADIRKAIEEPAHLREALDKTRTAEEKMVKSISEGYREFLDKMELSFAERHEAAIKEREEDERKAEAERKRKAEIERKKKMRMRIVAGCACAATVMAIVGYSIAHIINQVKMYERAKLLSISGDYDEAIALFRRLGDYKDALERIPALYYERAEAFLDDGNEIGAAISFGAAGDYRHARLRSLALWEGVVKPRTFIYGSYRKSSSNSGKVFAAVAKSERIRAAGPQRMINQLNDHLSEWGNLSSLTVVGDGLIGLKEDGTVVSTDGYCADWSDIVDICAFSNRDCTSDYVIGLKSDGTVVCDGAFAERYKTALERLEDIVMIAGSVYNKSYSSIYVLNFAVLQTDGTVVKVGSPKEYKDWTDIVSIVMLNDLLVGLKADGTVVVSDPDQDSEGFSKSEKKTVEEWRDIVAIRGSVYQSYTNLASLMGIRSDGSVVLSNGKEYPALPDIVTDSMNIARDSTISIYGLDDEGDPMIYTPNILDRWKKGEITDEEASEEAHHLVWGDIDFSTWKDFKLPN